MTSRSQPCGAGPSDYAVTTALPSEAAALQRKYVNRRRRWGRSIGRPFAGFEEPPPGELDAVDPENG